MEHQKLIPEEDQELYVLQLKEAFNKYGTVTEEAWLGMLPTIRFQKIAKGDFMVRIGQVARDIHFICKGASRTYFIDTSGKVYTKNLFFEGEFPASLVSILKKEPSYLCVEALENSDIIHINFDAFIAQSEKFPDLKNFYMQYLQKNWVITNEQKQIAQITENATDRYLQLIGEKPELHKRIAQHHIAAHLGITPTQLSRIRKDLK